MKIKMAYMTLNRNIPSRKADGVAVMNMCSQFAKLDFDVELVIPGGQAKSAESLLQGKTNWEFYSVTENFKIKYLSCPFFFSFPRQLGYSAVAVLRKAFSDNPLFYSRHVELAFFAALFGKISVFESHNYLKARQSTVYHIWLKIMQNRFKKTALIVTTQAGKKSYIQDGVPEEKILVEPNGVNKKRFDISKSIETLKSAIQIPVDKKSVGFCGHLYKGRGIEELLECAGYLKEVFFLIIGGEPEDLNRNKKLAKKLNLDNVKFTGFISQSEVPEYLLASDILVMPYTKKTLTHRYMSPMKMFDYLACGRPIVATNFPVIREVLKDRKNAVLVPPGSGHDMAAGIKWFIDHPESAKRISKQAAKDALLHTWEIRAKRITEWLSKIFEIHF
jgi:glycosyltransferase involved in cell wall biosynthesis